MKENLFEKYLSGKKGFYACLTVLILICLFVFKDFILFHNVFLYKDIGSDSVNADYTQYLNINQYIRTEGFPKWSFNVGMGQNIFPMVLRDPFDIVFYVVGKDHIAYWIIVKELIKIVISGLIFFLYLRKLSLSAYVSIIGAMLYSFSGFMILGSGWYIFTFEAMMLALMLYSFEKIFQDNSWYLFPILIAMLGISMPVNIYVYGLFIFIYMLFRYFLEKGMELKGLLKLVLKMALLGVLGVGMSSMFLFSNIKQLLDSPRVLGDASYFNTLSHFPVFGFADASNYITTIMRFFSNDLLGTGSNFKGWNNYLEAPLFYCGLLTLLLIPQVFAYLNKKQKVLYGVFLAIWLIPIIFPFFRYAFWLFTGDYYRAFSLCVATGFVFIGLRALNYLDRLGKVNLITLIITLVFLLCLLLYPYLPQAEIMDKDLRAVVRNFLIIYAILIYLQSLPKTKFLAQVAMVLALVIELSYFSSITVNKRMVMTSKELKHKTGFNDYTNDAVDYIKKMDNSFYRIDKNYSSSPTIHGGLNDPQAQNYKGTPCYNSFNQLYYIKFLQGTNVTNMIPGDNETETRRILGLVNRPLIGSLCSVKYMLSKLPNCSYLYGWHDSITQFGNVKLFRNKNYLPLGFTFDKYVLSTDFRKISNLQKDILLLNTIVIDSGSVDKYKDFTRFDLKDTVSNFTVEAFGNDVKELRQDSMVVVEYSNNTIKGRITLDKRKSLFLSIPFDKGWEATVDGKPAQIEVVDFGLISLLLDKGEHSIELNYVVPYLKSGIIVSGVSLLVFMGLVLLRKNREKKNREEIAS